MITALLQEVDSSDILRPLFKRDSLLDPLDLANSLCSHILMKSSTAWQKILAGLLKQVEVASDLFALQNISNEREAFPVRPEEEIYN